MGSRKELERQYVRSFQYFCSDFPSGEIQDGECPDFVVVADARRIGIEVTQIFKAAGQTAGSPQALEATKEAITVAARTCAEALSTPPAYVSLFFSLKQPRERKVIQDIARRVAQVVHDKMPPEGQSARLEPRMGSVQPREVDLILINRVHPVERHEWNWSEMGGVETDAIRRIEKAIEGKAVKFDSYLSNCDECWLLIVAPSLKPSGMIHPDKRSLSQIYASPFSRIYFLDFGRGIVTRLPSRAHTR
jgi:hypothetical protein